MTVEEAKGVSKDHSRRLALVPADPMGKRRVYACDKLDIEMIPLIAFIPLIPVGVSSRN